MQNWLTFAQSILVNYLSVENISKSFGERVLFENLSFGINKDQKIALVAKNGTGKTTLLNTLFYISETKNENEKWIAE